MKICQGILLVALSTGTVTAGAQTLPTGTVLVASETMPGNGLPFPAALASGVETPSLVPSTGASTSGNATSSTSTETSPRPLSGQDRFILFWNTTYASPGAYMALSAGALVDQVRRTPAKWDLDGSGYTRRFASAYGQLAARNIIHDGLAGVTGLDPRYTACKCTGAFRRSGHAVKMSFTTYRQDGRLTLDVPQIAGAYGSGMISTYWYPHRLYNPLVQGVQFGHEQMGEILLGNLVEEFGPDMKRALHLRAIPAHIHLHADEDDD